MTVITNISLATSLGLLLLSTRAVDAAFVIPAFRGAPNSEYSEWDVFYTPANDPNYPDIAAPNGSKTTASAAGVTPPPNTSPVDPSAFWDVTNPTLTQHDASAFIIGPAPQGSGNIYSFAQPLSFTLSDSTPYSLGTVLFQFQTGGQEIDYSTLRLHYGAVSLEPTLQQEVSAAPGAQGNIIQYAAQWDLTGLGITDYTLTFAGGDSSVSFQNAVLDTYDQFVPAIVPEPGVACLGLVGASLLLRRRNTL